ncbi:hypothetical protein B5K08_16030 [Rhizobium leguminosarum bv. trifolii]|uniref:NAD(+) hydrolase ThsA n=1 Tax=Rhizobium leguminosarum bv. trifolii TaxID=386 RepID=A0A3E1BH87_RHILT|nr:SIR2 family protein [Rhizobium leguminosarum]RFB91801.1 hypothetical protein B5K08_16030 [Rhizobium leguminosarum bv. trifolii]RFB92318.1 hypothetical protein B5K10_16025 [Rhizobium leguminosarum bv. trifolii]
MKSHIRAFVDDYLGEIIEGSAAIFAGAGLSVPAGYVDWRELIRPLSEELGLNIQLENDLVALAQFHVNASGANRHKLHKAVIEAIAADNPPTENHKLLAKLPIQTWWTTNYDRLIENSLRAAGKVVDVKSAVPQLATTRPRRDATVYKMHGDVDRPDEAVATRDDFERYPKERGAFVNALAGDLVSKTFLFLGFSFTDPNLEHVLTRVRLTFANNQRRHYAVFRTRTRLAEESEADFEHFKLRQTFVIDDLRRFGVRVLTVDDYAEITEFLRELVDRYKRRTVFVSASSVDFGGWSEKEVDEFIQTLGRSLVAKGTRIASGLGVGIGDSLLSGALREVLKNNRTVDEALILRPFPQAVQGEDTAELWERYRQEILSHAGIAIFLFGTKDVDGALALSDGMRREFEIARSQGVAVLPVGGTGGMAEVLALDAQQDPEAIVPELGNDGRKIIEGLQRRPESPSELIEPLLQAIQFLQGGKK